MRRLCLVMILMLVLLTTASWADSWYKVACHVHTVFSDGIRSFSAAVEEAKNNGFRVIIMADHVEMIAKKWHGFENYLAACNKSYDGITVIAGVEVTTKKAHTVVCGPLTLESLKKLNKAKTVLEVFAIAKEYHLITVAAHPYGKFNPYDRDHAGGVNGHELLNDKEYQKNIDWLLASLKAGWQGFVWAGIDSHTAADPDDKERWQRQTFVYAKSSSLDDILAAFRSGQVYAARDGCVLTNLSYKLGYEVQEVPFPHISFDLSFRQAPESIRIKFYCDGEYRGSTTMRGEGRTKISYWEEWFDLPKGKHWILIEVEGRLVTGTIWLDVQNPPNKE